MSVAVLFQTPRGPLGCQAAVADSRGVLPRSFHERLVPLEVWRKESPAHPSEPIEQKEQQQVIITNILAAHVLAILSW